MHIVRPSPYIFVNAADLIRLHSGHESSYDSSYSSNTVHNYSHDSFNEDSYDYNLGHMNEINLNTIESKNQQTVMINEPEAIKDQATKLKNNSKVSKQLEKKKDADDSDKPEMVASSINTKDIKEGNKITPEDKPKPSTFTELGLSVLPNLPETGNV